jgi:hypothetical protein
MGSHSAKLGPQARRPPRSWVAIGRTKRRAPGVPPGACPAVTACGSNGGVELSRGQRRLESLGRAHDLLDLARSGRAIDDARVGAAAGIMRDAACVGSGGIWHARLARRSACSGGLGHGDRSYQTPRKPCEPGARDGRDALIPTEGANSRRDRSPAADTIELRRAAPRAGPLSGCPISPLRMSALSTAAAEYLRKESAPAVATADLLPRPK